MEENKKYSIMLDNDQNVGLVTIEEVFQHKYRIPRYQRGYRWGKEQVDRLLDDLFEFYEHKKKLLDQDESDEEIYCLQPLVLNQVQQLVLNQVEARDTQAEARNTEQVCWNVVDGQQRLTTLYILLKYLANETGNSETIPDGFEIQYDSRKESWGYLSNITANKPDDRVLHNQDFYYMNLVKEAVEKWKPAKAAAAWDGIDKKDFLSILLKWVNFIGYKLPEAERDIEIDVFKRLNIGNIKLTESELIKAVFLNDNNYKESFDGIDGKVKQFELANEWDQIEYRLQDDRFWMFIHEQRYDRPTRIDFILAIARDYEGKMEGKAVEERAFSSTPVFDYYYEKYRENPDTFVKDHWKSIHKIYSVLCEWYNDEEIYHYIGFLSTVNSEKDEKDRISSEELISNLINERLHNTSKGAFIKHLKTKIKDGIKKNYWNLDFEYEKKNGTKKKEVRPLLLLHNIQTIIDQNACLKNEKKYNLPDFTRFPFHLYRKEMWDIEHIRPNNPEDFEGPRKKKLRRKYSFVLSSSLQADILNKMIDKDSLKNKGLSDDQLNKVYTSEEPIRLQEIINAYDTIYEESLQTGSDEAKNEEDVFDVLWYASEIATAADTPGDSELHGDDNSEIWNSELRDDDKNKIWNYVLLDASTNREYGNSVYSVKRDFIMKKERGIKPKLTVVDGTSDAENRVKKEEIAETSFVPICTMRVFAKSYTEYSDNLQYWTLKDAAYYRMDIEKCLWWYLYDEVVAAKVKTEVMRVLKTFGLKNLSKLTDAEKKVIYDGLFDCYYKDQDKDYRTTMKDYCKNNPEKIEEALEPLRESLLKVNKSK